MADFWGSIIGALLGGAVAILAGLLGARWSARYAALHLRAAQMHDTLVMLYADVYADIAKSEQEILHLTEPMMKMHGTGPDRAAIGGRILMLSPKSVQTAWAAYLADFDYLRAYVHGATNFAHGGLLDADDKQIVGCEETIAALKQAVQEHLAAQTSASAH
ncbi:hypothetical protein ODJ79_32410 [Actinoplanes sp. KI2]|uniref:hypothetical protein n=1 Tax=Actinoplanes sp. KI2 TaxID=2983315 RepID=UPI0021D5DB66|nr:hypothetical protein [Actinoplanes sp. KI2]MCU7728438.1 hypothetical protein [Actinoplanes sp. KI2]